MHGTDEFNRNWLFMMDLDIFTSVNPGGDVLSSTLYLRALLALLLAGVADSIKRTTVAMYFGRRTFRKSTKHGLRVRNYSMKTSHIALRCHHSHL